MKSHRRGYGAIPEGNEEEGHHDEAHEIEWTQLDVFAKACGLLYLTIFVCRMVSELGVRAVLIDFSSIATTVNNISQEPELFRAGLVADLVMCCADTGVAVLLAAIFIHAGVNPIPTITMSVFRFLQTVTISLNLLHMFVASILLDDNYAFSNVIKDSALGNATLATDQASTVGHDIAYLFLLVHKYGYLLALIFFGISLVIMSGIILKCGVFPHWLGLLICLAGLGYIVDSFCYFVMADYFGDYTKYLMIPALVSEISFTGWLLCCRPQKVKVD